MEQNLCQIFCDKPQQQNLHCAHKECTIPNKLSSFIRTSPLILQSLRAVAKQLHDQNLESLHDIISMSGSMRHNNGDFRAYSSR